jgi:hypothetical protein
LSKFVSVTWWRRVNCKYIHLKKIFDHTEFNSVVFALSEKCFNIVHALFSVTHQVLKSLVFVTTFTSLLGRIKGKGDGFVSNM